MIGIKVRFVNFYSYDILRFCNLIQFSLNNREDCDFCEDEPDTWYDDLRMDDPSSWEITPFLKYIFKMDQQKSNQRPIEILVNYYDIYESFYFLVEEETEFTDLFKKYKVDGEFNHDLFDVMIVNNKLGA